MSVHELFPYTPAPDSTSEAFVAMHIHVDDADAVMALAVENGATVVHKLEDHFYGERSGRVRDPFNQEWIVGHSIEEVSPQEMQRRYTALFSNPGQPANTTDQA